MSVFVLNERTQFETVLKNFYNLWRKILKNAFSVCLIIIYFKVNFAYNRLSIYKNCILIIAKWKVVAGYV